MQKVCKHCLKTFDITESDLSFYNKISPVFGHKKYLIPPPTLCPSCRFERKCLWRNERFLYRRKCDFSGQDIVSIYHENHLFPVYGQKIWWSDQWDPKEFAQDFDFGRNFFEQWKQLRDRVPRLYLLSKSSENSEFTNHASNNRNCHMSVILFDSEDVLNSRKVFSSNTVLDSAYVFAGELLYECFWVEKLYHCKFCVFCSNSSDLLFCYDCRGCSDCFMSSNLRNQKYIFRNKQLTKEEYIQKIAKVRTGKKSELDKLLKEFTELQGKAINPALRLEDCENVRGDFLLHCKDLFECYYSVLGENCRYCVEFDRSSDNRGSIECMDSYSFGSSELLYEVHAQANGYNNKFCNWSYDVSESCYLDMCFNISNCFGCVGLHSHEKYCILNKQYTQQEYEEMVPKIIEHMIKTEEWGEFFPANLSPFAYNETVTPEYFPYFTKEQAIARGYRWRDTDGKYFLQQKMLIPDDIEDVSDAFTKEILACTMCGKNFKIIIQELNLYRKMDIPIPEQCSDCRYSARLRYRTPLQMWQRACIKCSKMVQTSFAPNRPEIVYCQECYLKTVY